MTTQPEPTLVEFVRYNRWANQQLLAICMELDAALLTTEIAGGYGSILATFAHLLQAEADFLRRIHGTSPQPAFQWDEQTTLGQMAAFAHQVSEAFLETVQQVPPTQTVHEAADDWRFDYHARLIFMSLVYHGIAHRTDITTFLAKQGLQVPELDVWAYQFIHPERFEAKLTRGAES